MFSQTPGDHHGKSSGHHHAGARKVGVYLHWNSGRDTIEPLLKYCELQGYRAPSSDEYGFARICQVMDNFFGGSTSLGVGAYTTDRQIGGTIGGSAVGALFTSSLMTQLASNLGDAAASINANGLTPQLVRSMEEPLRQTIQISYNDALAPVFGLLVPFLLVAFVLLLFLKNKPLSDTNDTHETCASA